MKVHPTIVEDLLFVLASFICFLNRPSYPVCLYLDRAFCFLVLVCMLISIDLLSQRKSDLAVNTSI